MVGSHIFSNNELVSIQVTMCTPQSRIIEGTQWAKMLFAKDLDGEHRVSNASITNESSGRGLVRLPQTLEALDPDVVLLELGAVDGLRGQSIALIKKNLNQMIDIIEESGARVIIGGIRIPASYGHRYTESFKKLYSEIDIFGYCMLCSLLNIT